jgi:hypothetical protein
MRLTQLKGEHPITIPQHKDLRAGLLNAILTDIADYLGLSREEVIENLFEK